MEVYDVYGDEVATNWQDKHEFNGATWYRVVVDLNAPLVEGYSAADSLYGFKIFFGFGIWTRETTSSPKASRFISIRSAFCPKATR